jgi:hypothetical protein
MKQIKNNQKSIGKIQTSLRILKISRKKSFNQKSRDFCQILVIYTKKSIGLGMDLKIHRKYIG